MWIAEKDWGKKNPTVCRSLQDTMLATISLSSYNGNSSILIQCLEFFSFSLPHTTKCLIPKYPINNYKYDVTPTVFSSGKQRNIRNRQRENTHTHHFKCNMHIKFNKFLLNSTIHKYENRNQHIAHMCVFPYSNIKKMHI